MPPRQALCRAILALDERSWVIPCLASMVFHLALLVALALLLNPAPVHGNGRVGLIVSLSGDSKDQTSGYDDSDGGGGGPQAAFTMDSPADAPSAKATGDSRLATLLDEPPPVDPRGVLPSAGGVLGAAGLEQGGVGGAMEASGDGRGGPGGPGSGGGSGGKRGLGYGRTRTTIFGIPGEGSKFAYVFDRSGSTGGPGRNTLSAAKAQLLASLDDLDTVHQFQIIFYNEVPSVFNPSGQPGKLNFATERNKMLAKRFVNSITSDGGTAHEEALILAIKMQPDVIFFFTDADEPQLTARQLEKIHRMAAGITINAIEFGIGPQANSDDFMVKLARQNGGRFGYVDITTLRSTTNP